MASLNDVSGIPKLNEKDSGSKVAVDHSFFLFAVYGDVTVSDDSGKCDTEVPRKKGQQ